MKIVAKSSCVKCDNQTFELKEIKVSGSRFRLFSIQCARCGGVVGIQEAMNTSGMLLAQNKVINAIAAHVGIKSSLET